MNNQISSRTGYAPTELFLGCLGYYYEFLAAQECNTKVKDWLESQLVIAEKAQELLTKVQTENIGDKTVGSHKPSITKET